MRLCLFPCLGFNFICLFSGLELLGLVQLSILDWMSTFAYLSEQGHPIQVTNPIQYSSLLVSMPLS